MNFDELSADRDPVERLAEEFVERRRAGQRPSLSEYVEKYPQWADEIRELFPALLVMERLKPVDRSSDASAVSRIADRLPDRLLGDFRILREIGRGGMGVVYEAEQISLGRHVAVKVLPESSLMDARRIQRFRREAKAAARLHHTNVVPVHGIGEHGDVHFIVMQYIPGQGLDQVIAELKRLHRGGDWRRTTEGTEERGADVAGVVSASAVAHALISGVATVREPRDFEQDPVRQNESGTVRAENSRSARRESAAGGATSLSASGSNSSAVQLLGQSDASIASDSGRQFWHSVAGIGAQVADALAYAHAQGLQHRDIKPSNLLLDLKGTVWVTDFGLAKAAEQDENLTRTGDVVGTLRYMAPERFQGQADARADIYALGLTLYELLTLRPAFDETDGQRLIHQVSHDEPVRPRKLNAAIPRDLETIVLKAIAREPPRRYQTATELAADLRRFLDARPIQARRTSAVEHIVKWARRQPLVATLFAAVLLAVVAGVGGITFLWRDAEAARDAADRQRARAEKLANDFRLERDAAEYAAYRANIAAASSALDSDNIGAARRLLDDAPQQYRNWEWRYLHGQLSNNALELAGVERDIIELRFHPNSAQLSSLSQSGVIRTWDLASRKSIVAGPYGKGAWSHDGRWFFAIESDSVRKLNVATGEEITRLNTGQVRHVALDRNGNYAATATPAGDICLWHAESGDQLAAFYTPSASVDLLSFSPGGHRLIAGLGDGNVHLWEVPTGRRLGPEDGTYVKIVDAPTPLTHAISPSGQILICSSLYPLHQLTFTNLLTGELIAERKEHANTIHYIAISPDGRRAASASQDGTVRIWDATTGEPLHVLRGHRKWVTHVAFTADGSQLISTSNDGTSRIWDVAGGYLVHVCYGGQPLWKPAAVVSPDGTLIGSADSQGSIRLWALDRPRILRGHTSFVYDAAFSADGSQIVSGSWDDTIRFWDARTGSQTRMLRSDKGRVFSVALSPDGTTLASGLSNGTISLWDVGLGTERHQLGQAVWHLDAGGAGMAFGPNDLVAVPGLGVSLHDVQRGDPACVLPYPLRLWTAAFSRDGKLLAGGGDQGSVLLWNVESRQLLLEAKSAPTGSYACRVAFHPQGTLLASCHTTGKLRVWDVVSQREIVVLDHPGAVFSACFSPDGTRVATACQDGSIRLWDAQTWQQVLELRGHTDYVHAIAFSPDGTQLVSASGDMTVRIWDTVPVSERPGLVRRKNTESEEQPSPINRANAWHGRDYIPPKHYVCYRPAAPLEIDGIVDEAAWQAIAWTDDFMDIEGDAKPKPRFRTRAKMLWDDDYFYVAAELEEPHIWGTLTGHDSIIYHDNDFEVFIDSDGDNHNYAEFEINALGTGFDLRLPKPYKDGGHADIPWSIPGLKTAVHVDGTLNDPHDIDRGWTVELAFPWGVLGRLADRSAPPRDGDQWRVNLSRVQWRHRIVGRQYVKVPKEESPEDNWVWSPQYAVNMHRPETWGYVQFSSGDAVRAGSPGRIAEFRPDPTGPARHLLHRVYYTQRAFHEQHNRWTSDIAELELGHLNHPSLVRPITMAIENDTFSASTEVRLPDGDTQTLVIHSDARVQSR